MCKRSPHYVCQLSQTCTCLLGTDTLQIILLSCTLQAQYSVNWTVHCVIVKISNAEANNNLGKSVYLVYSNKDLDLFPQHENVLFFFIQSKWSFSSTHTFVLGIENCRLFFNSSVVGSLSPQISLFCFESIDVLKPPRMQPISLRREYNLEYGGAVIPFN